MKHGEHTIGAANYIIVYGDPANGFTFIGPFEYHGDAARYAEQEIHAEYWWIAPIEQPEAITMLGE